MDGNLRRVGSMQINIHKTEDIEKWKDPQSMEQVVIDLFKKEHTIYKDYPLWASFNYELTTYE